MTSSPSPASALGAAGEQPTAADLGPRAARTRERIISASRELFLEHGYTGTRIGQITEACGISRAGFYTYFRDKREIFDELGVAAYRAVLAAISAWDDLPRPASRDELAGWVLSYFALMDEHGPFIFSASQSAPADEQHRMDANRMQMRSAWAFGTRLQARQRVPSDAPDTLGLAAIGLLDQSWYYSRSVRLPISDQDMVHTVADWFAAVLG
jgi:AcrR family transcriptional regulator